MEAQETNSPSKAPTGGLALAAAISLAGGIGLLGLLVFVNRTSEACGYRTGALQTLIGSAGLLCCQAAPLFGLIAVFGAIGKRQEIVARSATESGPTRAMARRFLVAGLLFATVAFVPSVVAITYGIAAHRMLPQWWVVEHMSIAVLGLAMGWISLRLFQRIPGAKLPLIASASVVVLGVASVAGTFGLTSVASYLGQRFHDLAKERTFSGDSGQLERTVVVPTLDTPSPAGKNVIWCSSFQLAWNEIRDNVIGAPLDVVGAEELADRLNKAPHRAGDLEPGSCYAAGGWTRDGIVERIEKEMGVRFPRRELPDFNDFEDRGGILAYSYLTANVPFRRPFRQLDEGFTFTDSQRAETLVAGFGLWQAFLSRYRDIREQVEILYVGWEDPNQPWGPMKEYALDLCRHSKPYQVVVAVVEPKGSLAETYEHIQRGMEQFKNQRGYENGRWFEESDLLRVPEMYWRIDHRFAELIGRMVANVGIPVVEAMQTIEFRLDRSGAMLESEALVAIAAIPRNFVFNRPFLISMKKRDADRPFFVMWVDNAELLVRQ
ncbi:hypothetical protein [Anaerobaca lacustris]|uniref:Uncharacterized protein n=1 Tax=Anaerobaca lacustris TaxID=3044600 RepID=A0AAW6TU05_9BACT|nr:hypothetical protein [Sedimentisphaerales bacterium M17dextr]